MKSTTSQLIFLGTVGVFLIEKQGTTATIQGHSPTVIHSGYEASIYGAFIQHANDKFSAPTVQDIADLWATWSINNIEDGKLIEVFNIPVIRSQSELVWEDLGLTEMDALRIHNVLAKLNEDPQFGEIGPDSAQLLSAGAKEMHGHTELLWLGYYLGSMASIEKDEQVTQLASITLRLSYKEDGEPQLEVIDKEVK